MPGNTSRSWGIVVGKPKKSPYWEKRAPDLSNVGQFLSTIHLPTREDARKWARIYTQDGLWHYHAKRLP